MSSTELSGMHAGELTARRALTQAALLLDLIGRQLAVLRTTYPAWHIGREEDASGHACWIARLRPPFTPALAAAGIHQLIRQPDAIALAATLAWQSALLAGVLSRTEPH